MLVYIHGANATANSFNFLRPQLGDGMVLSYDSRNGFRNNLEKLRSQLNGYDDITFIAHSLGGVYALHLADQMPNRVRQGITMSTPYGGHYVALVAKMMMPFEQLLYDIGPSSWPMDSLRSISLRWPWTNIVTVNGNVPWLHSPNDGVVTIESQRHRMDMELIEVELNHYEVMLSPLSVEIIRQKMSQPK